VTLAAVALFGVVAVAGIAGPAGGGGTPAAASFRLADGSAGCVYRSSGEIACRAVGVEAAAVLAADGSSRIDSEAPVAWDDSTPVLLAAESWWHGAFTCRVAAARIVCSAGDGSIEAGGGGIGGVR